MRAYRDPETFRAWDSEQGLVSGEIFFRYEPTALELAAAFPNWVKPVSVVPATPTKEQLLAQLAALQAQIEAVKE